MRMCHLGILKKYAISTINSFRNLLSISSYTIMNYINDNRIPNLHKCILIIEYV